MMIPGYGPVYTLTSWKWMLRIFISDGKYSQRPNIDQDIIIDSTEKDTKDTYYWKIFSFCLVVGLIRSKYRVSYLL